MAVTAGSAAAPIAKAVLQKFFGIQPAVAPVAELAKTGKPGDGLSKPRPYVNLTPTRTSPMVKPAKKPVDTH